MSTGRRLSYQPALDGLRGVALLAVVAYHAGIDQLRGGFLGVSSFFTLSGFLITSLLLLEHGQSSTIELGSFWARRLRRLFPAALITITATVVLAALIADDSQLSRLRTDALASLFHFSNWRFITEGDSYGALFQSPSFFRHFWSLAVEEQYYVVFPLSVAGALRAFGGPTRGFIALVGVVSLVAVAWPMILLDRGASADRLYFGTDTRLGELIVGALLALWWVRRDPSPARSTVPITVAAVAAAVLTGWMWATAHPGDDYLYRGGLAAHAVLTLVVILAAIAPGGPVRAVLAWAPLRGLGVVSYGAYLFHWPILLWLQQETSLGPEARFGVGLVITVALATVSHRLLEGPIRRLPTTVVKRRISLAIPATLGVALMILAVTEWRRPAADPIDFAAAQAVLDELPTSDAAQGGEGRGGGSGDGDADGPVRLAGFGDSTALMTGIGLLGWAQDHPDELTVVRGQAKLGCGLVSGGTRRLEDREIVVPDECEGWLAEWPATIEGADVDIALVQLGAWEITDHRLEPGGPYLALGRDPEYESRQLEALDAAVESLLEHSDLVALIAHPDIGRGRLDGVPEGTTYPEYDPARSARWRALVDDFAAADPDVIVIDLASWIHAREDDLRLRPDGVHFDVDTAEEVAEWLAPEILARHREWRAGPDQATTAPATTTMSATTTSTTTTTITVPATTSAAAVPTAAPPRVMLAGDSLGADIAPALAAAIGAAPEPVDFHYEPFAGFPRTETNTNIWRDALDEFDPDIVIVFVGWWEAAAAGLYPPVVGEAGFEAAYRETVLAPWFDHLHEAGVVTIYLAMAPVPPRPGDPDEKISLVVAAAEAEAAQRDDVDFARSADAVGGPDGHVDVLADPRSGELERVRRIDGVHLCPDGAERVVDLVMERLGRIIDVTPGDDWRLGPWRSDSPADLTVECPPVDG